MTARRVLVALVAVAAVLLLVASSSRIAPWQTAACVSLGLLAGAGYWAWDGRSERRRRVVLDEAEWSDLRVQIDRAAPWHREPDPMLDAEDADLLRAELAAIDEEDGRVAT